MEGVSVSDGEREGRKEEIAIKESERGMEERRVGGKLSKGSRARYVVLLRR